MQINMSLNWLCTFLAMALFVGPVLADVDDDDDDKNGPKVHEVDCSDGDSIQKKLDEANPGETVEVSGYCVENININKDAISLIAEPGASIDGPVTTRPTIRVRGSRVRIVGFTLTGGSNVIQVQNGGSVTIQNNDISGANSTSGILVTQNSYAQIGSSASTGNNIHDNRRGVNVRLGSGADIFFNTITGDGNPAIGNIADRGIDVNANGAVDMSDNVITGVDRGLSLLTGGTATISSTPSSPGGANTFTNVITDIRCRLGGAATGGAGQIDGDGVGKVIDVSGCHVSSSVFFAP